MRLVPALIGILTLCAAGSAGAQIKSAVNQPTLPQPTVLQDTILISTFDLVQASSGGFQLKATILGLGKYVSSTVARDSVCITFG
jgi:hypothetical protein